MPPVFSKKEAAAILATVLLLDDLEEERIKKKREWCKNWFLKRNLYSHMKLLRQLRENETHDLKKLSKKG
jgi:cell division protein ZapA (FtsZ GTPase activity inhibitor)